MEVDYAFDSKTYFDDLQSPENIGSRAADRAIKALNPKKCPTGRFPVIFDRRVSNGFVNALAGAASGSMVVKGTTMLKDKMGETVFSPEINIIDDPFVKRGHRSHPFDAEGIHPQKRNIIKNGVLTGWFLDLHSARKLGLNSTGNAARSVGSNPHPRPANLYMENGTQNLAGMIKEIEQGFYITSLIGSGANVVTGDYSRGAKGFWIENGVLTYPVSEVTIAGNLKDMWLNLSAANDLELKYGIDAPSLRIDGITIAGE
jgi:PmbA protein